MIRPITGNGRSRSRLEADLPLHNRATRPPWKPIDLTVLVLNTAERHADGPMHVTVLRRTGDTASRDRDTVVDREHQLHVVRIPTQPQEYFACQQAASHVDTGDTVGTDEMRHSGFRAYIGGWW